MYEAVDSSPLAPPKFSEFSIFIGMSLGTFSILTHMIAVYYRLFDDHKSIASKLAFSVHDTFTGRFDSANLAPPRSVAIVKRHIASLEGIVVAEIAALYLHADTDEPAEDTIKLLSATGSPGTTQDQPLALTINRTARAVNTALTSLDPIRMQQALSKHPIMSRSEIDRVATTQKPKGWQTAKVDSSCKFDCHKIM